MDTASVSRSPSLQEWDVPVRSFGLRLKPLFSVCLFLKAAVHRPPPSQIPPRIEMDDMSDKGNRFQHFVIRQRKKLEHQMRRSLHLTLRKGRDANREMRRDGLKKSRKLKDKWKEAVPPAARHRGISKLYVVKLHESCLNHIGDLNVD